MNGHARTIAVCVGLGLLAAAAAWVGVRNVAVLRQGSLLLDDFRIAFFAAPRPQRGDIIVLAVDEDTVSRFPFRSPIDRAFLADTVGELGRRNVRALALDFIFDQPTTMADDQRLLRALAEFPAPLVIAVGDASNGLTARQLAFQQQYLAGQTTGLAGMLLTDGVVRHIYPGAEGPGGFTPGLAVALAAALGVPPLREPAPLYYRAPVEDAPPIRSFRAHDLPLLPRQWFEGAVVLLGADLPNQDTFRTPLSVSGSGDMTGVLIHAQAVAQLLDGVPYPAVGPAAEAAILLLAVAIGTALPFVRMTVLLQALAALGVLAVYWFASVAWFSSGGPLLPLLMPTLGLLSAIVLAGTYARSGEQREKRFIRETFRRYVSPAVIDQMLADPKRVALGGEKREMSFVFSDLEGFTTLSEQLPPEEAVSLLQSYLDGMLKIALEHGGTIDRLVGDGIAVFFGAPLAQSDHARRAVACARAWDAHCEEFRRSQRARGVPLGITRIGVHTGTAVVGNVGSTERFHYTAHGDCVNTAARLEGANRHLGTRVCMSREVAREHPQDDLLPVGRLLLKGKATALECVTFACALPADARRAYREAYALLDCDARASAAMLADVCRATPDAGIAALHLRRLERGGTGTTIMLETK